MKDSEEEGTFLSLEASTAAAAALVATRGMGRGARESLRFLRGTRHAPSGDLGASLALVVGAGEGADRLFSLILGAAAMSTSAFFR